MKEQFGLEDCEGLAAAFLGAQAYGTALRNILTYTERYVNGYQPVGKAGNRRTAINSAAKHAVALSRLLGQIDLRTLAEAMDNDPRHPRKLAPLMLTELLAFLETLLDVSKGLNLAADREPVRVSRPPIADPIILAVEALAALWLKARGEAPTRSYKAYGFGDFALTVLGPKLHGLPAASVRQAVRQVLEKNRTSSRSLAKGRYQGPT
jgi:hypothetical protein